MLVTTANFNEAYPLFQAALESCSFVSFDLEMSGIENLTREQQNEVTDSPSVRYGKMIGPATRYAIIQYGICLWTLVGTKWLVQIFTFFLFPSRGMDIVMQPSSIAFLKKNNMNFATWINDGLPYVDRRQSKKLAERYLPPPAPVETPTATATTTDTSAIPAAAVNHDIVLTKPADIEFMDRQKAILALFLSDTSATECVLESCNNYLRKCCYQYLERHHPTLTLDSIAQGYKSALRIRRLTAEEKALAIEQKKQEQLEKHHNEMGFTLVYEALSIANKPIVGHNCFFDCLFTIAKMDGPLPNTLSELVYILDEPDRTPFRNFLDTKYLLESDVLTSHGLPNGSDTALNSAYEAIKEQNGGELEVEIVQNVQDEKLEAQLHDAGYDAYITGYIFACLLNDDTFKPQVAVSSTGTPNGKSKSKSKGKGKNKDKELDEDSSSRILMSLQNAVQESYGHLFMMRSMYHMDLRVPYEPVPQQKEEQEQKQEPMDDVMTQTPSLPLPYAHGWLKVNGTPYHLFFPKEVGEAEIFAVLEGSGLDRRRIQLLWTRGVGDSAVVIVNPPLAVPVPVPVPVSVPVSNDLIEVTSQPITEKQPAPVQQEEASYYMTPTLLLLPAKWTLQEITPGLDLTAAATAAAIASTTSPSGNILQVKTVDCDTLGGSLLYYVKRVLPPVVSEVGDAIWERFNRSLYVENANKGTGTNAGPPIKRARSC